MLQEWMACRAELTSAVIRPMCRVRTCMGQRLKGLDDHKAVNGRNVRELSRPYGLLVEKSQNQGVL